MVTFCLDTTYLVYKGNLYKQKHGAAIGSPVSPMVTNLYIEQFEEKALATAPNPQSVWLRYVDDTFTQIGLLFVEECHQHLNSIDTNIKFTTE